MDKKAELAAAAEAVLFAMGEPVSLQVLASALKTDVSETREVIGYLRDSYETQARGIHLIELEGSYQLCTKPEFYENLITVAAMPEKPVLTDTVLETLSIVAYRQPVTKAEISRIRGVSSDHAVSRLVEYGLIREAGRLNAPGRPMLFVTTKEFLRRFGMDSLEQLPEMKIPEKPAEDVKAADGAETEEAAEDAETVESVETAETAEKTEKTKTAEYAEKSEKTETDRQKPRANGLQEDQEE